VELVERYLYVKYGWKPINKTNGAQVVRNYATQDHISITANGTTGRTPAVGDVMSFSAKSGFSDVGHTAVVTVSLVNSAGKGSVTVVGENQNTVKGYSGFTAGSATMTMTGWKLKSFDPSKYIEWLNNADARVPTAYVTNYGSNTVTPINTATNTPGAAIKVGDSPGVIAISPDGKGAYVANEGADTVTPIRTATGAPGRPIKVGAGPYAIAITPDGTRAYVTNYGSNTVTPINTATNTSGAAIKVGGAPQNIAITPDGKTAYVVNRDSDTVTPISTATNIAGKPIKVGGGPFDVAITPDGKTAYVSNAGSDTVTPIWIATGTPGKPIVVGEEPVYMVITPDG